MLVEILNFQCTNPIWDVGSLSKFINSVYDIKSVKLIIAMIYPMGLDKNNSEELTNNKQAVSWNISEVVYGEKYYYGRMETMKKIEVIQHLKKLWSNLIKVCNKI